MHDGGDFLAQQESVSLPAQKLNDKESSLPTPMMYSVTNGSMQKEYALITGAGRGLGKAYATELAKRGMNIILVGLHKKELDEVAAELRTSFNVHTEQIECDLSNKDQILEMAQKVNSNFDVSTLINNAGIGGTKRFTDADVNYVNQIIQLNVMGTSVVTHQLLPNLLRQKAGFILNVSSIAAYSPMGFKTVYPASKAFINHFSEGLRHELSDTNVFVGEIHPGPMNTSADIAERMEKQGYLARLALLTPETVAQVSLDKLFQRKSSIILNWVNRLNLFLMWVFPKRVITNMVRKELETS